jgi:GNAT superfamily N-acetyltransferase
VRRDTRIAVVAAANKRAWDLHVRRRAATRPLGVNVAAVEDTSRRMTRTSDTPALRLRAFEAADLDAATALSAAAFGVDIGDPELAESWRSRLAHPLATDPEGCVVAERDERLVGVAQALRREGLWCLSLLTVDPELQSAGAGRALLARSISYAADADVGLIISSSDPRALRLYGLAGFQLRPAFEARGAIDRTALPPADPEVREGGVADLESLAAISRDIRGAPHTPDLEYALRSGCRLVRLRDRGFAVAMPGRGVWLLVARDEAAAASLLWAALALLADDERSAVRWITAEQGWAVEIVLRAGLQLAPYGALCVRGRPVPLRAYLPSAPFA